MATSGTENQTVDTELPAAAALADGAANPTTPTVGAGSLVFNGTTWDRAREMAADGMVNAGGGFAAVATGLYNGTTWDRPRTPAVYRRADVSAAGSTALWTPGAGKKFRLLKIMLVVPNDVAAAAAGILQVTMLDGAGSMVLGWEFFVPNAAGAAPGATVFPWMDLGAGILSAAANNVLNVSLGFAVTTGFLFVLAAGTEE